MKISTFIKSTLLGGFIFLLPLTVLLIVIKKAFEFARNLSGPVLHRLPEMQFGGVALATLVTATILIVVCFLAGLATNMTSTHKFTRWLDDNILSFIPGYAMVRSMSYSLSDKDRTQSFPVVLARIEDNAWQVAFLVEKLENGTLAVYVPDSPSPFSGAVYYVAPDRVKVMDVEMRSALKTVRRLGVGSKELLKNIKV